LQPFSKKQLNLCLSEDFRFTVSIDFQVGSISKDNPEFSLELYTLFSERGKFTHRLGDRTD
jgi:hypothetical protein